jgi:hypothetical protein
MTVMQTIYAWFAKHFNHVLIKSRTFECISNKIGISVHRCRTYMSDMFKITLAFMVGNFKNYPFRIVGKVSNYSCHTKTISHRRLAVNHNGKHQCGLGILLMCYPLMYGDKGCLPYRQKGNAKNG